MVSFLHKQKGATKLLSIIGKDIMLTLGVIIAIFLLIIIIKTMGMLFMYDHDVNQRSLLNEEIYKINMGQLQIVGLNSMLSQKLQGNRVAEFISFYNDNDEMLDSRINEWAKENKVVITNVESFQTGKVSSLTHVIVTYHPEVTFEDLHKYVDDYANSLQEYRDSEE